MAESVSEPSHTVGFVDEQKSWHLLGLLLKMGRPVFPEQLASQCELFTASPDFIRFATSVPNSPLFLMENGLVSISMAAVFVFGRFFSFAMNRGFWPNESRDDDGKRWLRKRKGTALDTIESSPVKRRLLSPSTDGEEVQHRLLPIANGVQEISFKRYADTAKFMIRRTFPTKKFESESMHSEEAKIPLQLDTNGESSGCPSSKIECREAEKDASTSLYQREIPGSVFKASDSWCIIGSDFNIQKPADVDSFMECNLYVHLALPTSFQDPLPGSEALVDSNGFRNKMDYSNTFNHGGPEQNNIHLVEDDICENNTCKVPIKDSNKHEGWQGESALKEVFIDSSPEREKEIVARMVKTAPCREELTNGLEQKNCTHALNLDKDGTVKNIGIQATYHIAQSSSTPKQLLKSSCILKGEDKNELRPEPEVLMESLACNKFDNAPKNVDQCTIDQKFIKRHKLKRISNTNVHAKEKMVENTSRTLKMEKKAYPSFDTFTIEEEEGSGGYGTVYRARRKNDGKRLAIKCPHDNAHKNHVINELNMLERFGGKSFIIKFEGSFKSGSSSCFVLEHVEHDRPEVLKKEIDICQLQWYGYCMFKALASLHKEGVVHRDVKPGNFLFSRKLNKGYLIDFNLAMDLKQKYSLGSKLKPSFDASNDIPLPSGSAPLVKEKNLGGSKSLTSNQRELAATRQNSELNRHVKQKAYAGRLENCLDKASGNLFKAQGTDASGITSAKDVTSTVTPSAERPREPLPFRGRKELISLVQNSMQCPSHNSLKGPTSQRKRVAAPSGKVDGKSDYLTPMPLLSPMVAAGLLRTKGDGKQKREGSCVGTKGFRAPEVLFRSQFQGHKADVWSAGVTLLYLIIGKTPFTGDPEQNIKDIAKLKGSEDLWEVAKLHGREVSFPGELFHERYMHSLDLESWCRINTKRPEFLQQVPKALFDLIDRCLTVNPRKRISAEEAIKHEFFASCHEKLMKRRAIRRGISSDTAGSKTIC